MRIATCRDCGDPFDLASTRGRPFTRCPQCRQKPPTRRKPVEVVVPPQGPCVQLAQALTAQRTAIEACRRELTAAVGADTSVQAKAIGRCLQLLPAASSQRGSKPSTTP